MTKDEALKLALEALEEACELIGPAWAWRDEKGRPAITAIKEALAQEQEPVAWISTGPARMIHWTADKPAYCDDWVPLYTTPPQRTWVGLTDEEVNDLYNEGMGINATIEATEAKLKEKNT